MGMELTEAGHKLIKPALGRLQLVTRAAMAATGVVGMDLMVLYWG